MTLKQQRFLQMEITFALGKNEDHKPSGLGGRLILVTRQASKQ